MQEVRNLRLFDDVAPASRLVFRYIGRPPLRELALDFDYALVDPVTKRTVVKFVSRKRRGAVWVTAEIREDSSWSIRHNLAW
jgi:hypothetical protein